MKNITDTNGTATQEKTTFANASKTASVKTQNALLDEVMRRIDVKNDRALATALEVAPPVISKIRHMRLPVGATLAIRLYEESGISIDEITSILADPLAT